MKADMLLTKRLSDALALAIEVHAKQFRNRTHIPYISHPMAVASIALEFGADEEQAIAALLHDVLEDGGIQYAPLILEQFGQRVYSIVQGCTDGLPDKQGKKEDWLTRKQNYLEHLKIVSDDVLLVVTADKLHNARSIVQDLQSIGECVFERFTTKKEGTLWYYRSIADILYDRSRCPITKTLHNVVAEMENLTNTDKPFRSLNHDD